MSFSNDWDDLYRANTHMSVWPWSDLVSYVMRYARPTAEANRRVLELGCGAGANIPFFQWLGADYWAIDGSPAVIRMLQEKYPPLAATLVVGDFTEALPVEGEFDLVVDRAALTHNDTQSIRRSLALVRSKLRIGGSFIGIDWFSQKHSDSTLGTPDSDGYSRHDISTGQFTGTGTVHFSDRAHLVELFDGFEIRLLEEKLIQREIPHDNHTFASWNIHAIRTR